MLLLVDISIIPLTQEHDIINYNLFDSSFVYLSFSGAFKNNSMDAREQWTDVVRLFGFNVNRQAVQQRAVPPVLRLILRKPSKIQKE